jgi:two-component system CheB/CheR fusion protein
VRPADIGRPFTDLVSELQYDEIGSNAQQVLRTLMPIESAISASNGRWFTVRIMPYRTTDDRIDGLVLTFTDITVAKKLEEELTKANALLRGTK